MKTISRNDTDMALEKRFSQPEAQHVKIVTNWGSARERSYQPEAQHVKGVTNLRLSTWKELQF